jgi:hypothetical protein
MYMSLSTELMNNIGWVWVIGGFIQALIGMRITGNGKEAPLLMAFVATVIAPFILVGWVIDVLNTAIRWVITVGKD